jgi:ammonium transporter, Amt family
LIATGIFAKDVGLLHGNAPAAGSPIPTTFLAHLLALFLVSAFAFIGSVILFKVTDLIIPLRVSAKEEHEGLDLSQHGETAIAAELLLAPSTNGNGVHSPTAKELVMG